MSNRKRSDDTPDDAKRKHNAPIESSIADLEQQQARIVREHLLGDPTALARLQDIDDQIAALRPGIA